MKTPHMRKGALRSLVGAAVLGAMLGVAADRMLFAQQPALKRTILMRSDDPAGPGYEAVMALVELAPGASAGKHRHHGIEIGYILQGSVVMEHEGRPTATIRAGETFKNDAVHDARNRTRAPAKILAVYLVEKGKPLAEPVR
jgi:quercetin dioxygenase-like cupin family protein